MAVNSPLERASARLSRRLDHTSPQRAVGAVSRRNTPTPPQPASTDPVPCRASRTALQRHRADSVPIQCHPATCGSTARRVGRRCDPPHPHRDDRAPHAARRGGGRVAAARAGCRDAVVRPRERPVRGRPPPRGRPRRGAGHDRPGAMRRPGRVRRHGRVERSGRHRAVRTLARDPHAARARSRSAREPRSAEGAPLGTLAARTSTPACTSASDATVRGSDTPTHSASWPPVTPPPRHSALRPGRPGHRAPHRPAHRRPAHRRARTRPRHRAPSPHRPARMSPRAPSPRRPPPRVRTAGRGPPFAPWPAWLGLALVLAGAGIRVRARSRRAPEPVAAAVRIAREGREARGGWLASDARWPSTSPRRSTT